MDVLITCKRIFLDGEFVDGGIHVSADDGTIRRVIKGQSELNTFMYANEMSEVIDFGDLVLMPGLIDSHVHINDPGRSDWEGFTTATKAAAAGGFTTIVDMPLNSIPPTTTVENFNTKIKAAMGRIFVDVAFWGGVIPGNEKDLRDLVRNGVVGFKCFLCPSGVDEFPCITEKDLDIALAKLENTGTVLAFHAELEPEVPIQVNPDDDPQINKKYETYLQTRPPSMEMEAFKLIHKYARKYNTRLHIVHLSSAEVIPLIKELKAQGKKLTVETCHHYLSISAEEIPDAHTEYKCAPPIRSQDNQKQLWNGIVNRDIDLVVSDHSPCTPGLKCLTSGRNRGDFMKAWGGISSLQFGLPLFWTQCQDYGLTMSDMIRLLCEEPAKLCGLQDQKGKIAEGYDADFCIWNPDEWFTVTPDIIHFQNKANPYMNRRLRGVVHGTVVRGYHVYQQYDHFIQPLGKVIRKKASSGKVVKFD